ncbi:hypothetical protein QZH41_008802 [Actinostola sp. cb2023]|nr:hypothetical protein QZH41_008802 [Actinostola sp. cb2023]
MTDETLYFSRLELCSYSGFKIYPGHGKRYIRIDGKVFNFLNKKSANALLMRRNPRKVPWTVLYRRKHRKGTQEEAAKKRTRRNVKFQRSVQGATMENILAKRNQKPEMRKAQREQAIRYSCVQMVSMWDLEYQNHIESATVRI